jgi:hypothetical protein
MFKFEITLQPGAVVVHQQSAELPQILSELQALRAKVATLVPDEAQVQRVLDRMKANNESLAEAVAKVSGTTTPSQE